MLYMMDYVENRLTDRFIWFGQQGRGSLESRVRSRGQLGRKPMRVKQYPCSDILRWHASHTNTDTDDTDGTVFLFVVWKAIRVVLRSRMACRHPGKGFQPKSTTIVMSQRSISRATSEDVGYMAFSLNTLCRVFQAVSRARCTARQSPYVTDEQARAPKAPITYRGVAVVHRRIIEGIQCQLKCSKNHCGRFHDYCRQIHHVGCHPEPSLIRSNFLSQRRSS